VVIALILAQVGMGVITAHYAVEGTSFFGIPLGEILPFTVSRTIHTQFAVLWIATAWLATGLYIAPAISGSEPKFQKLGVNVLFYALLLIVAGSTVTGWLGTSAEPGQRLQLLDRQSGAGVHQHGPRLADPAVRRPADLGDACWAAACGRR
jgi:nitric oxide reductase subunit B